MVIAKFEFDGDQGLLYLTTHFGESRTISCSKNSDEFFRLGGTAVNEIMIYEGVIYQLDDDHTPFKAFKNENDFFTGIGVLSSEQWDDSDLHCYVHEYYNLYMEGRRPGWFLAKKPIQNAHNIFVNVDITDGGGNLIKRYRISPFTGNYVIL